MDDTMEIEEIPTDSINTPPLKENNGILEDTEISDSDCLPRIKANNTGCTITNIDNGDLDNSIGDLIDEINAEVKDHLGLNNSTSIDNKDNSISFENSELNSLENHKDSFECNATDELTSEVNKTQTEVLNDLHKSKDEDLLSETINNSPKPSSESVLVSEPVSEKENEEKLKEENIEKEPNENVSSSTDPPKNTEQKDLEEKDTEKDPEANENHENVPEVAKKKEESGKKKKGKTCVQCLKKKKIEFRIHFQGKTHVLCSDACYKEFKEKRGSTKPTAVEVPKEPEPVQDTYCAQCQKLVTAIRGYYPVVGDVKPLCSEDCMRKYQDNNGPPRKCGQCDKKVEDKSCHLTWETMVFCSEDCLGKYQSFLGSHCTCCQAPVQQASLGKYCVCFGSDIRQFCSGSCLDDFKKGLKVCTFCQTDLSAGTEGFLAPVGDKGQFKDFCSQACMERYETMNNLSKNAPEVQECAHCKKIGTYKIQVPFKDKKYFVCGDNCVSGLRCALKQTDNVCASCHCFFKCPNDLNSNNKENEFKFKLDGLYKFFCCKTCMTTYVLSHRRITQCLFCKVKKYNFDMIEKTDRNVGSQIFCSLNCLSLFRVNVNAASSKSVRCDNCTKNNPAQYHLTMSDGSIRNFCTYNCVLAFQNQFTSVPALTTTSMTRQMTTTVQTLKTTSATSSPVIANVMSLAQSRPAGPILTTKPLPQSLVSVRPRQPIAVFTTKPQISTSTITSPSVQVGQSTTSTSSQVMREVIVQPPAPKSVKNKTVWCKPIMQTKGVNAKIPACHKACQTDDNPRAVILPVPIPVYIPTPLHMFSRPVPCPVPFPVPIPIPIIIPSSRESQIQVMKHLKRIQTSVTNSPVDEVSNATEKSTDDSNKSQSDVEKQSEDGSNDVQALESVDEEFDNDAESEEPQFFLKENESHKRVHSPHKHQKHKRIKLDGEVASEESGDVVSTEDGNPPATSSPSSSFALSFPQPGSSFHQSPPQPNTIFETPGFNFEEEEQTMLKVP